MEKTIKTKVVLVQLGSPKTPAVSDVREYLREFLGDPRVVDINPTLWKIILNCFVLPFRPARSAKLYSRIWNKDRQSFPLIYITEEFAQKVAENLKDKPYLEVNHAFLLSSPRVHEVYDSWIDDRRKDNNPATRLMAIPMFPQYSESTIASGIDGLAGELGKRVEIPDLEIITNFHKTHAFIDNSVEQVNKFLAKWKQEGNPSDELVISFHGIPKRRVIYKFDDYFRHCFETFYLIKQGVQGIDPDRIHMTFQSRFGSEEWLTPYTDEYVSNLVEDKGAKNIAVYCPSFVADCLETIDEIGTELQEEMEEEHPGKDVKIQFVESLNTEDKWCKDFATYVDTMVAGSLKDKENLFHDFPKEAYAEMPEVKMEKPILSDHAKTTLRIVFLTLFLDLIGFSIIFPLFPSLAKHYLEVDGQNYFLNLIFNSITSLSGADGSALNHTSIVLFGGALGALYSFLQFIAAPLWGGISDRIGRKPVLMISVACLALSYLLWFFSGSFTLLILARFIGGIMGGNISTATAVVADVTEKANRSKGMAFIGIAFAMGFILGPAIGGISSLWDISASYPALKAYGVNPFSLPAAIAFVLSAINLFYIARKFKETLPPEKRGQSSGSRTINPIKMFKPLPYEGVNLTNFGHFLFLAAFSGMEFTLTFVAFERLSYTSMDNAYMFIFIGFIIALVQGGVVRRKAADVGEKKMALMGMIFALPGLIAIGYAQGSGLLYLGLFFLAVGSAMVIPCLTSLVSMYTPADEQGRSIGIFRSLGAMARVIGPIVASLVYWSYGSAYPYLLGAAFLIIPIILISRLPKPNPAV